VIKVRLLKTPHGLVSADDESSALLADLKTGTTLNAQITEMRERSLKNFRRWWALVEIAFNAWNETDHRQEYNGMTVEPNMERFRKDVTILTGHYEASVNLKGEVRLDAKSISFGAMSEEAFEQFFSKTIDVILTKILPRGRFDEKTLRDLVEKIVRFD